MKVTTLALCTTLFATTIANAYWVQVEHLDAPTCDPLSVPFDVDELGSPMVPFPADELIDHQTLTMGPAVCMATDNPNMADPVVEIRNLTNRTFRELWYVADSETSISNVDGFVEDVLAPSVPPRHLAFRIDNDFYDPSGTHHPLLAESSPGGGFEPGESWSFVLQDYSNALGLPPDAFTSLQVAGASINVPGVLESTGSIIAIPVPEQLA